VTGPAGVVGDKRPVVRKKQKDFITGVVFCFKFVLRTI
jgi:hypothetical protein